MWEPVCIDRWPNPLKEIFRKKSLKKDSLITMHVASLKTCSDPHRSTTAAPGAKGAPA